MTSRLQDSARKSCGPERPLSVRELVDTFRAEDLTDLAEQEREALEWNRRARDSKRGPA